MRRRAVPDLVAPVSCRLRLQTGGRLNLDWVRDETGHTDIRTAFSLPSSFPISPEKLFYNPCLAPHGYHRHGLRCPLHYGKLLTPQGTSASRRKSFPMKGAIHPGPPRCAPSPHLRMRLNRTPCGPGASPPSLQGNCLRREALVEILAVIKKPTKPDSLSKKHVRTLANKSRQPTAEIIYP